MLSVGMLMCCQTSTSSLVNLTSFNLQAMLYDRGYAHFPNEETEAQKGTATCLRSTTNNQKTGLSTVQFPTSEGFSGGRRQSTLSWEKRVE